MQLSKLFYWVYEHWLELFGVATSLLYIYLEIRQKSIMWVVGFISSAIYALVFFRAEFYAFSGLYVYYILVSVYGMYCWRFAKNANDGVLPVSRLNLSTGIVLSLVSLALFVSLWYVLDTFISPDLLEVPPYCEALAVALSVVATWMLAQKILEQWLVWIFVNFFSAALYFWGGLYPTCVLFVIYGIMSIVGWRNWRS